MKTLAAILLLVIGAFVLFAHEINEDDRRRAESEREWVQFSIQHHCRIVRADTFSDPTTLWECDGNFQVRR
jgi:hypothetical protein